MNLFLNLVYCVNIMFRFFEVNINLCHLFILGQQGNRKFKACSSC